jgi:aryl-alcohol dehydrogenase-like predicted oxidoreductase
MSLAWLLKNPNVSSVITGASRPEQVVENMKAVDVVLLLSGEIMARIESVISGFSEEPDED